MFGFVSKKKMNDALSWQQARHEELALRHEKLIGQFRRIVDERDTANARLSRIAALETPACASIGKRMARIARGEI